MAFWPLFWRRERADVAQVKKKLEESQGPDAVPTEKLRGLIQCVRHRKESGYEREDIAARAKITLKTVTQIVRGDFTGIGWESVERVLVALDATQAEVTVALELYEQIAQASPKATFGPRSSTDSGPIALIPRQETPPAPPPQPAVRPEPVDEPGDACEDEHDGWTEPVIDTLLELGRQVTSPVQGNGAKPQADTTSDPVVNAPGPEDTDDSGDGGDGGDGRPRPPDLVDQDDRADQALDPMTVKNVREFAITLEHFRIDKGNRVLKDIAVHCQDLNPRLAERGMPPIERYSVATFSNLINHARKKGKMPRREPVRAYVAGAGGSIEDVELFTAAWTRLEKKRKSGDL